MDAEDIDFDNYLMATIRLPVRITRDGDLLALHDYADIVIGEIVGFPKKSSETSVFKKVVAYAEENPEYLRKVAHNISTKPYMDEVVSGPMDEVVSGPMDVVVSGPMDVVVSGPIDVFHELHEFPFLRRRQKPKNMTFRLRHKASNFTKKGYCQ